MLNISTTLSIKSLRNLIGVSYYSNKYSQRRFAHAERFNDHAFISLFTLSLTLASKDTKGKVKRFKSTRLVFLKPRVKRGFENRLFRFQMIYY